MKRIIALVALLMALIIASATPVIAAPNENASHVAQCATQMGGQHVADCAQTMDRGVSECAQMTGTCDMH